VKQQQQYIADISSTYLTEDTEGVVYVGGASWVGGAARVEAGALPPGRPQPQGLPAARVGQLGAGHDGLVVLQPRDAGRRGALHVTGQHRGEAQNHGHLRSPAGTPDGRRRWETISKRRGWLWCDHHLYMDMEYRKSSNNIY